MHRIFLGLAVTVGSLLVVTLFSGFLVPSGQGGALHDLHFLLGLLTVMATLLIHSIAFTYFLGTGKWVKEVVRVYQLPPWVWSQAVKNKRRAFPFELASMLLIGATSWLGAAADTRRALNATYSYWHLMVASATLAFNLGAFVVEYVSILAQARLLLEVKDQADRLREARASGAA
ncbi:MAG: hypothetical protein JWN86_4731 [Planctomycetota bacterium]|nr:hypothetical protein [Planctomycetota bacterium]